MGECGTPNIDIEEGWIEIAAKGRKGGDAFTLHVHRLVGFREHGYVAKQSTLGGNLGERRGALKVVELNSCVSW